MKETIGASGVTGEMSAANSRSNGSGPFQKNSKLVGLKSVGPVNNGLDTRSLKLMGFEHGLQNSSGESVLGFSLKGATNGPNQKQWVRQWCEHCRRPRHEEDTC